MNKKMQISISVIAICLLLTIITGTGTALAQSEQSERLSGSDRYSTASAISARGWQGGSQYVILARGDDFADALCAGPLAKKLGAPILLTQTERMNASALNEIKRLGASHVIIIGGPGAVSQDAENELRLSGIAGVERIYGRDRFETSAKIAERIGTSSRVVLATGSDFPDALSISAIAAKLGMPILLTQKESLPEPIRQYISSKGVSQTFIIGGSGVISDSVMYSVPGYKRLGGRDRYETNVNVMQEFAKELDFKKIYMAVGDGPNGDEFADALAGAVLAANTSSPVVLVFNTVPQIIENYLKTKVTALSSITALGGEGAVPSGAVNTIVVFINNPVVTPPTVPVVTPPTGPVVPPPAAPVEDVNISSIKIVTNPGNTIPAADNGDTIDLSGLNETDQVTGISLIADQSCTVEITGILDEYDDELELPEEFSVSLSKGVRKSINIDSMLEGYTSGSNGVSIKSLRLLFGDKATIEGKIKVGGENAGTVTIRLKLN